MQYFVLWFDIASTSFKVNFDCIFNNRTLIKTHILVYTCIYIIEGCKRSGFWTIRSFPEKKQMFYYFYGSLFCQSCFIEKLKQQLCDIRGDSSDWFMAYFFIILQGNWSALFQSRTTFKRFVSSNKWLLSKQIIDSFFPNSFLYFFSHIMYVSDKIQRTKLFLFVFERFYPCMFSNVHRFPIL